MKQTTTLFSRLAPSRSLLAPPPSSAFLIRSYSLLSSSSSTSKSTSPHHDLASFLAHAARTGVPAPTSTTYAGTHFEYTAQASLARYGLALRRVGGRHDHGIDLLGAWTLPSTATPLKVLVQCKALRRPAGPSVVRELEGAFAGAPIGWRADGDVLGVLVARARATRGVRDALGRSRLPLACFMLRPDGGTVEQCLWNRAAGRLGLEGVAVTVKHDGVGNENKGIALTWKGDHLPGENPARDNNDRENIPADVGKAHGGHQ